MNTYPSQTFPENRSREPRFTLFHEASITWTPKQRLHKKRKYRLLSETQQKAGTPGCTQHCPQPAGLPPGEHGWLTIRRHTVLMGPRLSRRLASPVWQHSEKAVHTLRGLCTHRRQHMGREKYCQPSSRRGSIWPRSTSIRDFKKKLNKIGVKENASAW